MKEYDVIVVGTGSGMEIVQAALSKGLSVALIDKGATIKDKGGPIGGTCLTVGCIPSKLLVAPADKVMEIKESAKLGIKAEIKDIDFGHIMDRMRKHVRPESEDIKKNIENADEFDFYYGHAEFTGDYEMTVNKTVIKAKKIFLMSGSRPEIPAIKGIDKIEYLTNETVLDLKKRPKSIIIVGGGYIACEYAHFFSAMGTEVTIMQRNINLVPDEEPDISKLLKEEYEKRMTVYTNSEAQSVAKTEKEIILKAKDRKTGKTVEVKAEMLMIAAGRVSNADLLKVEKSGIKTDEKGYIIVDEHFQTTKKDIFALGDATGMYMFKHVANDEAEIAAYNLLHGDHGHMAKMNYSAVPHAVFSWPEIAGAGLKETDARKKYKDVLIGKVNYDSVAKGEAIGEKNGFSKAIVDKETGMILGFHIIGPHASILIQEVINAMANNWTINELARGMHIHPAMPELILRTLGNLK